MVRLPAPRHGVLVVPFGDGAAMFDPVSALLHVLNPEAALIMQGCTCRWSSAGLVGDIARTSGIAPERVEEDIETCLAGLRHLGVLTGTADHAATAPVGARPSTGVGTPTSDEIGVSGDHSDARGPATGARPVEITQHLGSMRAESLASRSFAVLDEVVVVRSGDRNVLERVDLLFEDLVVDRAPTQEWSLTLDADGVQLNGPAGHVMAFHHVDALVHHLPTVMNEIAATSTAYLALHAGAVRSPSGDVVLLPAVSGSGKSTLTAWMVQRGWGYLSDETAAVGPGLSMAPYPKPLILDGASRLLLGLEPSPSASVRATELRPGAAVLPVDRPQVGRIVLVSYKAGARATVVRLERDAAVLAVAEHALNLRRAGASGLATLIELVTTVPCHRLTHGGLADAQAALEALSTRRS